MEFSNSLVSFFVPSWLLILAGFVLSLVITWKAIPSIVNVAQLTGLDKKPNHRSSHKNNTPLFGGVAVFAGFVISTVVISGIGFVYELKYIIAGLIILFFVGIKDDIFIIDPKKKLVAQIVASLIIIILGDIRIENFQILVFSCSSLFCNPLITHLQIFSSVKPFSSSTFVRS